jgi:hypothetical protein
MESLCTQRLSRAPEMQGMASMHPTKATRPASTHSEAAEYLPRQTHSCLVSEVKIPSILGQGTGSGAPRT